MSNETNEPAEFLEKPESKPTVDTTKEEPAPEVREAPPKKTCRTVISFAAVPALADDRG